MNWVVHQRLRTRRTLLVAALALVAVPFGILVLEVARTGGLTSSDQRIANRLNTYNRHHGGPVDVAKWVTQLGSTVFLTAVVMSVATYLVVRHRHTREALFLITSAVVGLVINNLLKVLVGRNRPHFDGAVITAFGKSFPSGHALNSTVVYGALLVLVLSRPHQRRTRVLTTVLTAVLVVAIAVSRVVLTVHYVSDVVAGITLGIAVVLTATATFG